MLMRILYNLHLTFIKRNKFLRKRKILKKFCPGKFSSIILNPKCYLWNLVIIALQALELYHILKLTLSCNHDIMNGCQSSLKTIGITKATSSSNLVKAASRLLFFFSKPYYPW